MLGVVTQCLAEITVLAEKGGVSRADFLEFLNDSVMGSVFTRYKSPAFVNLDFTPTFTPILLRKDFDLGLAAAHELDVADAGRRATAQIGAGQRSAAAGSTRTSRSCSTCRRRGSGLDAGAGERPGRRRPAAATGWRCDDRRASARRRPATWGSTTSSGSTSTGCATTGSPGRKAALEASECGAFLLFDFYNIRYTTQTWIGGALGDKMTRYALLTRGRDPMLWDFGSAVRHHKLYSPWLPQENCRAGHARLARRGRPDARADGSTRSARSRALLDDAGVADAAGRRGHRRAAVPVRDAAPGPDASSTPSSCMLDARRDQVRRRDHAAQPGGGHGRRRLPGHRRGAQARRPRERDRRAGQQAALRDGLRPGRGRQRDLRRAVQPAPAQLHRPAHPPGRPGVLRHHPLLQRLPDLLLPHVRRRQRHAEPARRLHAGARVDGRGDRRRSSPASAPTRSPRCWPKAEEFGFEQRDGGLRPAVRPRPRARPARAADHLAGSTA